jgi:hypothetical protein
LYRYGGKRIRDPGGLWSARSVIEVAPVDALVAVFERVLRLLDPSLVGLAQDGAEDPVHPHSHLPPDPLLLLGRAVTPEARVVVAVPARLFPREVADGFEALLPEHVHEAGEALTLDLFEGLEIRGGFL